MATLFSFNFEFWSNPWVTFTLSINWKDRLDPLSTSRDNLLSIQIYSQGMAGWLSTWVAHKSWKTFFSEIIELGSYIFIIKSWRGTGVIRHSDRVWENTPIFQRQRWKYLDFVIWRIKEGRGLIFGNPLYWESPVLHFSNKPTVWVLLLHFSNGKKKQAQKFLDQMTALNWLHNKKEWAWSRADGGGGWIGANWDDCIK